MAEKSESYRTAERLAILDQNDGGTRLAQAYERLAAELVRVSGRKRSQ